MFYSELIKTRALLRISFDIIKVFYIKEQFLIDILSSCQKSDIFTD